MFILGEKLSDFYKILRQNSAVDSYLGCALNEMSKFR